MLKRLPKHLHSETEAAYVLSAIRAGIDAEELTRELSSRHAIEPGAWERARRIVDMSSARCWLAEGVPSADVITILEVRRRFEFSRQDCRTYSVSILRAVQEEIRSENATPVPTRKES
jgi:hypothetical protein